MATIVNNQPPERVVSVDRDDSGGWAVAVVILVIVVAIGGFLWYRSHRGAYTAPAQSGSANINVTLPSGNTGGSGGTGSGGTGGGAPNPTY